MEKTIYLMPRRSGKSTLSEYEFNKDTDNTMFIVFNNNMMKHIDSVSNYKKHFFTAKSNLRGLSYKKAVIDEYLLFDLGGLKNVYENLHLIGIKEVFIFTTNEQYDKDAVDWIKSLKLRGIYWRNENGLKEMPNSIRLRFETNTANKNDKMFEHLDKIHFNFLTDPNTKVVFKLNKYNGFNTSIGA